MIDQTSKAEVADVAHAGNDAFAAIDKALGKVVYKGARGGLG
jgi:hypothetical protein